MTARSPAELAAWVLSFGAGLWAGFPMLLGVPVEITRIALRLSGKR